MTPTLWYLTAGLLLVALALTDHLFKRLPVSGPVLCIGVGVLLGPVGLDAFSVDLVARSALFEHLTEVAVLISLFTAGLTMRSSLTDPRWLEPIRLATIAMFVTIAALAGVGMWLLALPLGAAILFGAVLAPTDPVLASDVQLEDAGDRDELRHGLTGEAGLNDGLAFPFVMLGLGLLGPQPFSLVSWFGRDFLWAIGVGLGVGGGTGWALGRLMLVMQRRRDVRFGLHESIALGVVALAYGLAEVMHGYGFLAVFAAGYALRYIELRATGFADQPPSLPGGDRANAPAVAELRRDPGKAAHHLTVALLHFNQRLEHVFMAGMLVLVGSLASLEYWPSETWFLVPLLFLVIRPASVAIALVGSRQSPMQRFLAAWFGIRGLGSIYYLAFAVTHGLPSDLGHRLVSLVLPVVVMSILVHGASASLLMTWYDRRQREKVAA